MRAFVLVGAVVVAGAACTPFGAAETEPGDGGSASDLDRVDAASDAGATSFCARSRGPDVVYCADFEDARAPLDIDEVTNAGLGEVSVVPAPGRAGGALRVTLRSGTGSRDFGPVRRVGRTSRGTRIELDLDVRVAQSDLWYAVHGMLAITGQNLASFTGVASYTRGAELGAISLPASTRPLAAASWVHVKSSVTIGANGHHREVRIDGRTAEVADLQFVPDGSAIDVVLGSVFTSNEPGGADVLFDDVIVRVAPN